MFLAVVRASRAALPFLTAGTSPTIINIASGSGLNPSVRNPAYGAAKAAVIHYTRSQAAALIRSGIRSELRSAGFDRVPRRLVGAPADREPGAVQQHARLQPGQDVSARRRRWRTSCSSWPRPVRTGSRRRSYRSMAGRACVAHKAAAPPWRPRRWPPAGSQRFGMCSALKV